MKLEKIDLFKMHQDEFAAPLEPLLVETRPTLYLTIEGMGEPGGEAFQKRLQALYSVAHSLKRTKKGEGQDYVICKLEGLWWGVQGPGDFSGEPPSDWNWRLMIRTPDFVGEEDLKRAVDTLVAKGKPLEVAKVRLQTLDEGTCVQMLHIGSYSAEQESIEKMNRFIQEKGLSFHGLHHEIYLSDPRRVPEGQLRTILRMPVC